MICQNCKKQINEESKTCPECGVIIAVEKPTNNVIIEQNKFHNIERGFVL